MRQEVMAAHGIHSAIFIDTETELEIIRRDLARLDRIGADYHRVYLDETSIFTLAHARCRGLDVQHLRAEYATRLKELGASILFLDVGPDVSWRRRGAVYETRVHGFPCLEAQAVLAQYRRLSHSPVPCTSRSDRRTRPSSADH
jgi:hypothetical protein